MRHDLRESIETWDQMDGEEKREVGKLYGIKRKSLLLEISSLHFPRSFPLDYL